MGSFAPPVAPALADLWPIAGLVVRTPRLEVRWPSDDDLVALADVAAEGVHGHDEMPFSLPWTRGSASEVRQRVLQWHWLQRSDWSLGNAGDVEIEGLPPCLPLFGASAVPEVEGGPPSG